MGAIGEYVHLTAYGYNHYGIYRWGHGHGSTDYNFDGAKKRELDKVRRSVSNPTASSLQDLENTINGFFSRVQNNQVTEDDAHIMSAVTEQMSQQFNKLGHLNFNTGNVENSQYLKDTSISQIQKLSKKKGKTYDMQYLQKKINQLELVRENLGKSIRSGDMINGQKLEGELKKLKQQMIQFENELLKDPAAKDVLLSPNNEDMANFVNNFNKVVKEYAAIPPIALEKGEFFEYLVPYIVGVSQDKAVDTITKEIDSLKVGKQLNEQIHYSPSSFALMSKTDDDKYKYHSIQFDQDILTIENQPVQGKIDVFVQLNGTKMGASLKNYNLSSNTPFNYISLVSGTNLLYVLQDLGSIFVNHYLNLNAQHRAVRNNTREKIDELKRKESQDALRAIILAKGLTGNMYKRNSADLFILNDNQTGKTRVYSMRELIDKIEQFGYGSSSVKLGQKPIMEQNLFVNSSLSDDDRLGMMRISALINSLHKIQVYAALEKSWF